MVRKKRPDMKTASKCNRNNPTNTNALKLKKAQNELANIYLKEQAESIQNQINKIRDSVENRQSRIAWQMVDKELDLVLRKIKNGKVAGLHEIPPDVWETRQFNNILLQHSAIYNQNPINKWTKGCILSFPKKGNLRLAKNCQGITLTSIATKIYNALLQNHIEPKIENILRKNQNGFRRNRSTTSQILTIHRILEGRHAKNLVATILFVNFTKVFDSIHTGKMEQILLAYSLPKEAVAAIMMLYRNTKVKVRSPDGDTDYFNIVAGVLQGDTYLFIIYPDYVLRTSIDKMKENGFKLTKERSRRYPTQTIMDADYTDDIVLPANAHAQAETLLHSLE